MQNCNSKFKITSAFTLPEILIAVAIFSTVSMVIASLYIQSFQETRRANLQNQVYEDARFIMERIAQEVREGMIDYDEYYNQNVVIPSLNASIPILGIPPSDPNANRNFGQNFGRYYSSFFHTGQDEAPGFDCNTVVAGDGPVETPLRTAKRNQRNCTPLRKTIDRNTGANPFKGKYTSVVLPAAREEDAFCGTVTYETGATSVANRHGQCTAAGSGVPDIGAERMQDQLFLISADGFTKTILARERIGETPGAGGAAATPIFSLALLRLKGLDVNRDGVADHFVCADDFQCRGTDDAADVTVADHGISTTPDCAPLGALSVPAELPRRGANLANGQSSYVDLSETANTCDPADEGFSKDFVPISPFRVNISRLNFFITPTEDPHYAFSESAALAQPRVTIVLTVEQNPTTTGVYKPFPPITLTQTVSSQVLTPVPAPLLIQ